MGSGRAPTAKPSAIGIDPAAERALRSGHPWLFEPSVASASRQAPSGEVGVVLDRKDRLLAAIPFDPEGPIRLRVLAQGDPEEIGSDHFRTRLAAVLGRRSEVASRATSGFRVNHGENDGMGGLVAKDRGPTAGREARGEPGR